jgi:hypothetical protein
MEQFMALFGKDTTPAGNDKPPAEGRLKTWRAKVDCIWQNAYVHAGATVQAETMDNPHFEPAQE